MSDLSTIVFAVTSGPQWEAVSSVAQRLVAPAEVWDPVRLERYTLGGADPTGARIARPGYRTAVRSAVATERLLREVGPAVYVAAQDMGLSERAAIASARRQGAPVVLLPDGLAFDVSHPTAGGFQRLKNRADGSLAWLGLLSGRRGAFGASDPDLVLSWGDGWGELWRARAPSATVIPTGSARSDGLVTVGPPPGAGRVLVCSQRLDTVSAAAAKAAPSWYSWLDALSAQPGAVDGLRLRLHPAEQGDWDTPLGPEARSRCTAGPLLEDLAWADAVVAPFSTVLLEAAAVGRAIRCADAGVADMIAASPFFRSIPAAPIDLALPPTLADLRHWAGQSAGAGALGRRFLSNIGTASERVADVLDELAGPA